jgi:hypothetical protein
VGSHTAEGGEQVHCFAGGRVGALLAEVKRMEGLTGGVSGWSLGSVWV